MALTLNLSPSDIIIPVMGATGAGKSTFIQNATGQHVEVGHGLESCTLRQSLNSQVLKVVLITTRHYRGSNIQGEYRREMGLFQWYAWLWWQ
jgi:ABC-type hemin transport system ATPase subunit